MAKSGKAAGGAGDGLNADDLELEAERLEKAVERKRKALRQLKKLSAEERTLGGDPEDPDAIEVLPGAAQIQSVVDDLHGKGSFEVHKLEGETPIKCGTFDLDLWPEQYESTMKARGAGEYLVIVRNGNGTIATRVTRSYRPAGAAAAAAAPAPSSPFDGLKVLELMQRADERHAAELRETRMEIAKIQAESQKLVMEVIKAQVAKPEPKGLGFNEIEKVLDVVDRLRGDGEAPAAPSLSTDNPWVALIDRAVSAIALAVAAKTPTPPPAAAPKEKKPEELEHQPTAAAPEPEQPGAEAAADETAAAAAAPQLAPLTQYVPILAAAVGQGMSADAAAEKTWTNATMQGETLNLKALLEHGDWEGLKVVPELKAHAKWIDEYREKLVTFFKKPAEKS